VAARVESARDLAAAREGERPSRGENVFTRKWRSVTTPPAV